MIDELNDDDWAEAFGYVGEPGTCSGYIGCPSIAGRTLNGAPFTREDVSDIIASREGENDAESWMMVGHLKSGLFFYLEAWCDYTGWD